MFCQKCRTPVRPDASLDDLNPAAFKLLTESTSPPTLNDRQVRPSYSQDKREQYRAASKDNRIPTFKRNVTSPGYRHGPPPGARNRATQHDNPTMSFVMLSDSQVVPPPPTGSPDGKSKRGNAGGADSGEIAPGNAVSSKAETLSRLFEILSSRSDIDHPICAECTELLVDALQKRLNGAAKERDAYVSFLRQANADIPSEEERQQAQQTLAELREKEKQAMAELEALEREKAATDANIVQLELEARALDEEEAAFWASRNAFTTTLTAFRNERDALSAAYHHDHGQLQRLQRTNVYNDTFCIGHDGHFGTINGLRLGRLAAQGHPVDWAEINAAWGQTCLLLATVADRFRFTFRGYRLHPQGSTSFIERLDTSQEQHQQQQPSSSSPSSAAAAPTTPSTSSSSRTTTTPTGKPQILELYCSGDLPLGLGFLHRRFDSAMVAFLECLRQLGAFVEHGSPSGPSGNPPSASAPRPGSGGSGSGGPGGGGGVGGLQMPYAIRKDRIHDASIRLGFNQDEAWTRACKYTLTCCKYLLAHASNVGGSGGGAASGRARNSGGGMDGR